MIFPKIIVSNILHEINNYLLAEHNFFVIVMYNRVEFANEILNAINQVKSLKIIISIFFNTKCQISFLISFINLMK